MVCERLRFENNFKLIKRLNPKLPKAEIEKRIKAIEWDLSLKPYSAEVTVNTTCNNRCLFCYNDPKLLNHNQNISFEKICKVLYIGKKQGCWIASIIGGEPTLREDIFKISEFARKLGYECIKLCTNGRRLSDIKYAKRLIDAGFNSFDISLHSSKSNIHDTLVGRKGAFKETMKAMENIKELGAELATAIVLNKLNYKDFVNFFNLTYNKLQINYFNIIAANSSGAMRINKELLCEISDLAVEIRRGLKIAEAYGFPFFTRILINFPPCLLPEYLNIIADWETNQKVDEVVLIPEEKISDMKTILRNRSAKIKGICGKCILNERCRGFNIEYIDQIDIKKINPIKKIPKQKFKTTFTYEFI
ncbi:MAG: radical SAM protein [Elusimicrobiota bacterium]